MSKSNSKPKSLKKREFLEYWANLHPGKPITPRPVPYKHTGSTYMEDGIRITGTRQFVDQVLSRLQELLEYEAEETRLQVNYQQSTNRETGQPVDAWNCYIQVHERGGEAKMANLFVKAMTR